jgi:hypothetical protein
MSSLITIALFCSALDSYEGDSDSQALHPNVRNLLTKMGQCGFNGRLRDVTDATGGGNVPAPIFIGCFKCGDINAFVAEFKQTPWFMPDEVLLVVQCEHGPEFFKFYRPWST